MSSSTSRAAAFAGLESRARPSADQERRQDRHELALWLGPPQGPAGSACDGCGRQVPFLVWVKDPTGWRCTICADGRLADVTRPPRRDLDGVQSWSPRQEQHS
jgi:hypothetical protein